MLIQPKLDFLHEKIMDIRQALFFDMSSAVLKLPTAVINVLRVDEIAQVWFVINKPSQQVNEFDREFRTRLDFYKKGKSFYLHLTGKGCLVSDPEEVNSVFGLSDEFKGQLNNKVILIKVKIEAIHYYPLRATVPVYRQERTGINFQPSAFVKTLQYIFKDIIPVFQSH